VFAHRPEFLHRVGCLVNIWGLLRLFSSKQLASADLADLLSFVLDPRLIIFMSPHPRVSILPPVLLLVALYAVRKYSLLFVEYLGWLLTNHETLLLFPGTTRCRQYPKTPVSTVCCHKRSGPFGATHLVCFPRLAVSRSLFRLPCMTEVRSKMTAVRSPIVGIHSEVTQMQSKVTKVN
jgi:hypothetical protein